MRHSLSLLLLFVWSLSLNAQTTVVGSTDGVFNVSDLGGANYSIPIKTPEGIAGIQPSISLSYNSQGGNGIVGMGWNLGSGASAITRIPNTIYNDKKVAGVSLTAEDRFALDGNRLILMGGAYGLAGSSYHTEVESFKEINALGTLGTGPMSFTVTDQNGVKYEYGIQAISRPTVPGKVEPYMWLLDKVTDLNGNFMEYTYQYSPGEEPRVTYINYTGNVNTGAQTKSVIYFFYENRPDPNFSYVAGGRINQSYRLTSIYVRQRNTNSDLFTLRTYQLEYTTDIYTHLTKVIEKGQEVNGVQEQLPPTEFTYGSPTTNAYLEQHAEIPYSTNWSFTPGDYNGDGKTDVLRYSKTNGGAFELYFNSGSGSGGQFTQAQSGILQSGFSNTTYEDLNKYDQRQNIPFDYNGDGKDDFACFQNYNNRQKLWVYLSDGSIVSPTLPLLSWDDPNFTSSSEEFGGVMPFTGDFDGDGKSEILALNTLMGGGISYLIGEKYNRYTTALGYPASVAYRIFPNRIPFDASYVASGGSILRVIDYNGDGKDEILSIWRDDAAGIDHAQVFEMNVTFDADNNPVYGNAIGIGTPIFKLVKDGNFPTVWHEIYTGDFNGDAITDVLTWIESVGWEIGYGKGDGSMNDVRPAPYITNRPRPVGGNSTSTMRPIILTDLNGDGKCDIFEYTSNIYNWGTPHAPRIIYSKGNHSFQLEQLSIDKNNIGRGINSYYPGDYNGDGQMDIMTQFSGLNPLYTCIFHPEEKRHLVAQIKNGLGSTTKVDYAYLTNPDVYSKGIVTYIHPYINRTISLKVVSNVNTDNGINTLSNNTSYKYEGFKYNVFGRGLLGFTKVISNDVVKGMTLEKHFALNYAYGFPWLQKTYLKQGQQTLSLTTSVQAVYDYGNQRIFPYTTQTTTTDNIKNTTATETYVYSVPDNNLSAPASSMYTGKPQSVTTNKGNGLEITTQAFTYPATVSYSGTSFSNTPTWIYSKPKSIVTINTRQGQLAYIRRQDFTYSTTNGLLLSSVGDPSTSHAITTTNTYNVYGNPIQKTISTGGVASRTEIFQYDPTNRFVTKSNNADYPAIQTNTVYDIVTGTVSSITQADGLTKNFTYDGFGRVKTATDNNGSLVTTDNLWAMGHPYAPVNAQYMVLATSNISGTAYAFHDRLGRLVRSVSKSLNGQMIFVDENYDNKGQLISKTDPYFQGSSVQNNTWTYDNLGRATYQSTPSGNNSSFAYTINTNGALVTATNAAGQSKKTYTDQNGTVIKTEDDGGILEYTYHSNGKVKTTVLNGTTVQQTEYDAYGRQTKRTDPNYGSYEYTYNNFDEILSQKDPKGAIYNFTYDNIGNLSTKSGPEGTYTYVYNTTSGSNCGKLVQLNGPGGVIHNYSYGIGDKVNYEERIIGSEIFKTQFAYNGAGKLYQTTYPNGTVVRHGYNSNNGDYEGAMLYNPNLLNSWWLYRIKTQNVFGQNTSINLNESMGLGGGNYIMNTTQQYNAFGLLTGQKTTRYDNTVLRHHQYTFQPTTGNLLQRKDLKYNLQEDFTYDNINRLTGGQAQVISSPASISTFQMNYAANGNVTQKSDAGTFSYDQANRVSEISPYINIPEVPQDITYTPFDKVSTIEEGTNKAQFNYWGDGDRSKMELLENGVLKKAKYYAGNFEKEIDGVTGEVRELCYVYDPDDNLVSILERKNGEDKAYYVLTDHLGSITQILDENGNIVDEKSFDAWGRSRNPQTWAALPPTGISNGWDRGYTGHEHLPQFGIINMNGRLYDPLMGRMMEPDPLIIGANNSQGYNRYSYALNNPLSYTDPDGHHPVLVAIAVGAAISALTYTGHIAMSDQGFSNWDWGQFTFSVGLGAVSGALTAGIGSALSGVSFSVGREALRAGLHGVNGYITSGGDFSQGWAAVAGSAVGSLFGGVPVLNTHVGGLAFASAVGGATSSIAGGDFLEGAVTAGLVHELNFQAHKAKSSLYTTPNGEATHSVEEWSDHYAGKSWNEITTDNKGRDGDGYQRYFKGLIKFRLGPDPQWRYVKLPDSRVLDMRHVLVVGMSSEFLGAAGEYAQFFTDKRSFNSKQDFMSNAAGAGFLKYLGQNSSYYNTQHSTQQFGNARETNISRLFHNYIYGIK